MEQTTEYQEVKGNRNVKSTLFPKIFADKKELLELFNAVNGTNYQDTDDFEINTIEGILYMTTKNDVSFLVESAMNLYEQQSTYNSHKHTYKRSGQDIFCFRGIAIPKSND